jgi:hypothetical protein
VSKQAQLADGTILEFPDETQDAVIDRVVREHIAKSKPQAAPAPRQRTTGEELRRQAGLGVRHILSAPIETAGIFTDPINQALGLGPARQGTQWLGDMLGLPNPETSAERVSGDVSKALIGTGMTMGMGSVSNALRPLASAPGTQAAGTVLGVGGAGTVREMGYGPGAQLAAGFAGAFAPATAGYAGSAILRGAARGGSGAKVQQAVDDFHAVGSTPSVGQATGNRRTQGLESLLAGGPTSSGVIGLKAEQQADEIGAGLSRQAENLYRNASAERAGKAVERGVDDFVARNKATRDKLYAAADAAIPPNTAAPVTNTQQALASLTAVNPSAPNTTTRLINPKIAQLAEDVAADIQKNGGRLPYEVIKDIRSRIGTAMSDFSLTTDKPTAEYKALYAALSRDMEAAARSVGPQAEQSARRANHFFKASMSRIEQLERVVDKNGGPEKIYAAVMSGTRDGGTTVRAVMQSLPPEGRKALAAAVVKRMGLATPGQQDASGTVFSAQSFLTNWNNISPETKAALFNRMGPSFTRDMDRVARVADTIRKGSKVYANPSGTANKQTAFAYWLSVGGSLLAGQPGTTATLLGGGAWANVMARAMTNPAFVRWLAQSTTLPASTIPQQALNLARIAGQQDDEEMKQLARELYEQAPNKTNGKP